MRLLLFLAALLLPLSAALAHGEETHGQDEVRVESPAPDAVAAPDAARPSAEPAAREPRVTFSSALHNLHPATVRFPIGLLVAAALVELLAWRRRSQRLQQAATVMVAAGAIGAVIAALFGWIHTGLWFGGQGTMQWHRWLGTNLAGLALITWWSTRFPHNRHFFRILLFATAGLLLVQGYLGGELSRGPNHLSETRYDASSDQKLAQPPLPQAADDRGGEESPLDLERAQSRPEAVPEAVKTSPAPADRLQTSSAPAATPVPSPSPTASPGPEQADPHAGHDMDASPTD